MARISVLALLASLAAGAAEACPWHEEGGGRFSGYESQGNYENYLAMRARIDAEREQAMEAARRNFLARFDIKTDAPTQVAAVDTNRASGQDTDADRRARADVPAR